MLCVTGNQSSTKALEKRLIQYKEAELQEIRLDLLQEPLERLGKPDIDFQKCIITCRAGREGGGFEGSEHERIGLLESTLELKPGWLDIELSTPSDLRSRILTQARKRGVRVLLSHHRMEPGQAHRCGEFLSDLAREHPDGLKLAVAVTDACELEHFIKAQKNLAPMIPNRVLLGMGAAGLLSRAMYTHFGSTWTYAACSRDTQTAPGQLTADDYRRYNLPPKPGADLYVLLGTLQIMQSPGPRVYNQLFSKLGISAVYLPVVTEQALPTLQMLKQFGLRGASVTMPLKKQLATHLDNLGQEARATGVVNTVTYEPSRGFSGDLTDGLGARAAVERYVDNLEGKKAVVLGSGATATAVAHGLTVAGAKVFILARNAQKARHLAEMVSCEAGGLERLSEIDFDILVQTTPVGAQDSTQTLVSDPKILTGKTVLDVVLGAQTRLLQDAQKYAANPIPGRSMWAEQGRLQLRRWLGLQIDAAELERDP